MAHSCNRFQIMRLKLLIILICAMLLSIFSSKSAITLFNPEDIKSEIASSKALIAVSNSRDLM